REVGMPRPGRRGRPVGRRCAYRGLDGQPYRRGCRAVRPGRRRAPRSHGRVPGGEGRPMSPVQLTRVQREALQREIDRNRRWERRLPWYALIALAVIAGIVAVRAVYFP